MDKDREIFLTKTSKKASTFLFSPSFVYCKVGRRLFKCRKKATIHLII